MKKILIILLIFLFTINTTNAWLWLIAQTWDLLNTSKWNEMINLLETKIERTNILAWSNIVLTNSWTTDLIIKSTWSSKEIPFISNSTQIQITKNTQSIIIINWTNFLPNSEVIIPNFDGTIDNVVISLWNKIELTLTPWSTVTNYDIIISNEWTQNTLWSWNWVNLLSVTN